MAHHSRAVKQISRLLTLPPPPPTRTPPTPPPQSTHTLVSSPSLLFLSGTPSRFFRNAAHLAGRFDRWNAKNGWLLLLLLPLLPLLSAPAVPAAPAVAAVAGVAVPSVAPQKSCADVRSARALSSSRSNTRRASSTRSATTWGSSSSTATAERHAQTQTLCQHASTFPPAC